MQNVGDTVPYLKADSSDLLTREMEGNLGLFAMQPVEATPKHSRPAPLVIEAPGVFSEVTSYLNSGNLQGMERSTAATN